MVPCANGVGAVHGDDATFEGRAESCIEVAVCIVPDDGKGMGGFEVGLLGPGDWIRENKGTRVGGWNKYGAGVEQLHSPRLHDTRPSIVSGCVAWEGAAVIG